MAFINHDMFPCNSNLGGSGDYRGYYAFGGSSMELGIKSQYVMKRDILAVGPL